MNGLRVYINPDEAQTTDGGSVFYSCREGGPYYRWHFEQDPERWLCSRVHPLELTPRSLCMARWNLVPKELQLRIREHYLE